MKPSDLVIHIDTTSLSNDMEQASQRLSENLKAAQETIQSTCSSYYYISPPSVDPLDDWQQAIQMISQAMDGMRDAASQAVQVIADALNSSEAAEFVDRFSRDLPLLDDPKALDRQRSRDDLKRKRREGRGKGSPHWRKS